LATDLALYWIDKEVIEFRQQNVQLTNFSVRVTGRNKWPCTCCCDNQFWPLASEFKSQDQLEAKLTLFLENIVKQEQKVVIGADGADNHHRIASMHFGL